MGGSNTAGQFTEEFRRELLDMADRLEQAAPSARDELWRLAMLAAAAVLRRHAGERASVRRVRAR